MGSAMTLIGRDTEMAAITTFLEAVPSGPSALLISGEPGIGKTSLLSEGVNAARDRSFRVLLGRPVEAETRLSFAGLDDLVGGVFSEALPELPPPQQQAIRAALLLEGSPAPSPDPRAIGLAFLGILRFLARSGPVLIAVDDVQWLDAPTTTALAFALRRLDGEPIGLLAAQRSRGDREPSELDMAIHRDRLRRLDLGPLTLGALHRLIATRLGRALSRPGLVRIHTASGGNPFYAVEMARALIRIGGRVDAHQPLPVPENLRDLLRARLTALPPAAREVLPAVAAMADPTVSAVESVAPSGRGAVGLEAAADAGVVEDAGERERFTHPLLSSAVYSRLLPGRRRELHRRLAAVVRDPEERARHLALGADEPDAAVAAALDEAERQAAGRGAPDIAAELAEMASSMTPPEDV
jgi:predicted ATPase